MPYRHCQVYVGRSFAVSDVAVVVLQRDLVPFDCWFTNKLPQQALCEN